MKPIRLLLVILCFNSISCEDSDELNLFEIRNENVVFVDDDRSVFGQGDYLWFNINVPTMQTDAFFERGVDIYKMTRADATFFGFSLFEADGDSSTPLRFGADEIIIETGDLHVTGFEESANTKLLGVANFSSGTYKMRVGIPLESNGQFFLANSETGVGGQGMSFNPKNGSDAQITLSTKIRNSDSEGRYHITVN
ncbi:hypothetical protein [Ulvibacterium marinum]|uniref:Uncharacterized protein n=1 Tax=Ulvibacterium marinum TaxID=2419782 RepID=A0A3B0CCD5_9FLAO|nr:hypothetical protein [Ulvibacterium marinum]RKN81317.1 hypothetical protein D7Z94_10290 [Ulvibacterium marinum]